MEITSIEWEEISEDSFAIRCPICDVAWLSDSDGEYDRDTCEHLRFVWTEDSIEYIGEWDEKEFEKSYLKIYSRIWEEEGEDQGEGLGFPDYDVLQQIKNKNIKKIYEFSETGLACGPITITTLFGLGK